MALGLKTSIWTIDLAYLLTRFGVGMRMSTLTLGVDKNYAGVDFYSGHLNEGACVRACVCVDFSMDYETTPFM